LSSGRAAVVQWTRTHFEATEFSVYGPSIWNSLPPDIRTFHSDDHSYHIYLVKLFTFSVRKCGFILHFFIPPADVAMLGRSVYL